MFFVPTPPLPSPLGGSETEIRLGKITGKIFVGRKVWSEAFLVTPDHVFFFMRVGEESPAPRGRKKVRKEQMRLKELIDLCAVIGARR